MKIWIVNRIPRESAGGKSKLGKRKSFLVNTVFGLEEALLPTKKRFKPRFVSPRPPKEKVFGEPGAPPDESW